MAASVQQTNKRNKGGIMSSKLPYLLQTGMGVDLHGSDDTTAAIRAIRNAIANNNLLFVKHLEINTPEELLIDVTIACPHPERLDRETVLNEFPVGTVSIQTQVGGMDVDSDASGDPVCIAIAAVQVAIHKH